MVQKEHRKNVVIENDPAEVNMMKSIRQVQTLLNMLFVLAETDMLTIMFENTELNAALNDENRRSRELLKKLLLKDPDEIRLTVWTVKMIVEVKRGKHSAAEAKY